MTHTAQQGNRSADDTVTRVIPIETILTQAQLQVLAAKLKHLVVAQSNWRLQSDDKITLKEF